MVGNIMVASGSTFIRPVDRAMIFSSSFILIYTFITVAFNYIKPFANPYLNLMAFDSGIFIAIIALIIYQKTAYVRQ